MSNRRRLDLAEAAVLAVANGQLNREAFTRWVMANQRPLDLPQAERLWRTCFEHLAESVRCGVTTTHKEWIYHSRRWN